VGEQAVVGRGREAAVDRARREAVEPPEGAPALDGIVVDRVHAASRTGVIGARPPGWGRIGRGSCAGAIAASQGKSASMVTSAPGMSSGVMVAALSSVVSRN
jgi:hypothetical protein